MAASGDLVWQIIRNNHAFLMHQRGIKRTFSKEAGNLKNVNSPRLSGLANKNVVAISPTADGKQIVLTASHPIGSRRVAKSISKTTLKKGARPTYKSIRGTLKGLRVSRKIRSLALRRASAHLARKKEEVEEKKAEKTKK